MDPKQWFLSLPSSLRRLYSSSQIIKVQTSPNRSPIELFTFQNGVKLIENALVVHGLGLSSFSFHGTVDSLGSRGVHAEAAIRAIGESTECEIPIWRRKPLVGIENSEMGQQRFVGILNSLDIVSFLVKSECLEDQEKAMKTPYSEVVVPNGSLLRQVDPGTRNGGGSLMFCDTH
ncbi:hypothetical protein Dsin_008844 [Dipteronia sinensis]|uniref:CBS domain-containing protein n=1 Tax=Dipteronia sinensis TaxID=43782 RepID=A0AAE0AQL7_9ROSI|nr:hypothetical protein Dsin_008844 [Dipteronia sinensis]